MSFRATNIIPETAYTKAKKTALGLSRFSETHRNAMLAGPVGADRVLNIFDGLKSYRDEFNTLAAVPGLAVYAQDQENDASYDVAAEFQSMVQAVEDAVATIHALFPTATFLTLNLTGDDSYQEFSTAQTAQIQTDLAAVIASIS